MFSKSLLKTPIFLSKIICSFSLHHALCTMHSGSSVPESIHRRQLSLTLAGLLLVLDFLNKPRYWHRDARPGNDDLEMHLSKWLCYLYILRTPSPLLRQGATSPWWKPSRWRLHRPPPASCHWEITGFVHNVHHTAVQYRCTEPVSSHLAGRFPIIRSIVSGS